MLMTDLPVFPQSDASAPLLGNQMFSQGGVSPFESTMTEGFVCNTGGRSCGDAAP